MIIDGIENATAYQKKLLAAIEDVKELASMAGVSFEQAASALAIAEIRFLYDRLGEGIPVYEPRD